MKRIQSRFLAVFLALTFFWVSTLTHVFAQGRSIPLIRDAEIEALIRDYTSPLLRAAGVKETTEVILVNDMSFNAFVDGQRIFVNIGAYVDEGTMVDTWATVGSCAQIGKNVHLSGGVGIGGVLEPLQASPTIIEDNCFIGARSEVVEGCIIREGSVLGMGVFIGQSTRIVDRESGEIFYGEVPPYSVVVAGSMPTATKMGNGELAPNLYCAVIVKRVDERTRAKTSINELLRS